MRDTGNGFVKMDKPLDLEMRRLSAVGTASCGAIDESANRANVVVRNEPVVRIFGYGSEEEQHGECRAEFVFPETGADRPVVDMSSRVASVGRELDLGVLVMSGALGGGTGGIPRRAVGGMGYKRLGEWDSATYKRLGVGDSTAYKSFGLGYATAGGFSNWFLRHRRWSDFWSCCSARRSYSERGEDRP